MARSSVGSERTPDKGEVGGSIPLAPTNFCTKQIGDASEALFVAWCLQRGLGVSIPFGDRLPYDVVVDIRGRLVKVQIKTTWRRKGRTDTLVVGLTSTTTRNGKWHSERYVGAVDVLVAYDPEEKKFYCFDQEILSLLKRDLLLRVGPSKNNQTKNVRKAADYLLESAEQLLR